MRSKFVDNSYLFLYATRFRDFYGGRVPSTRRIVSKIITAEQNPIAVPNKIYRACVRVADLSMLYARWWKRIASNDRLSVTRA